MYLDSPGRTLARFEHLFTSEIPPGRRFCLAFILDGVPIPSASPPAFSISWAIWVSYSGYQRFDLGLVVFLFCPIYFHQNSFAFRYIDPRGGSTIPYKGMLGWFGWFLQLECIIGPCVSAYNALTCVITDQMNQCYTTQDIPADNYRDSGGSEIRLSKGCMTVSPNLVKALVVETEHVRTRDWIAARRP